MGSGNDGADHVLAVGAGEALSMTGLALLKKGIASPLLVSTSLYLLSKTSLD
jgi:hypothetical protein